jgi:hypothetical protein
MEPQDITGSILRQLFEMSPGESLRVGILYKGVAHMLLWLKVGKDGSIYCRPRLGKDITIQKGKKIVTAEDSTFNYTDLSKEISWNENVKLSFHASGVINASGERLFRNPIRNISERQQLCQILFVHPTKYRPVQNLRKNDIVINPPFNENSPLCGYISVSSLPDNFDSNDITKHDSVFMLISGVIFSFISDFA